MSTDVYANAMHRLRASVPTCYMVVYKPHGALNCETQYYGPFHNAEAAYDYLCTLPAIGYEADYDHGQSGHKFVEEVWEPTTARADHLRDVYVLRAAHNTSAASFGFGTYSDLVRNASFGMDANEQQEAFYDDPQNYHQ